MSTNKNEETGVIMKIQKQSGCLLIVIGAAMLAFVLTDLLKSGPSVFSGSQNVVGEIAGDKVTYEDYAKKVDDLKNFYQQDLGGSGDDAQFQEMAWNQMVQEKIIKKQHRELGLLIGAEEFKDLTTGANPDPSIIQAFQDQETKQFNRNQLVQFLEVQMQEDERKYRIWYNYYEVPLREKIEGMKYDKMVKSGVYISSLDAKSQYDMEHYEVSAAAVGIAYASIEDSTIAYTDSDLSSYLSKHSEKYQQKASRDIEYVAINVFPTAADTMEARKWAEDKKVKFANTKKDSAFVTVNRSSTPFDPMYKTRGSFAPNIEDQIFTADTNVVIGPIYSEGVFSLYKVTNIKYDTLYTMRAKHVLLPLSSAESEEAGLANARKVMAELRSGSKDFNTEARNNYDGTGASNGDLGWVSEEGPSQLPEDLKTELFKHAAGDWFVIKTSRGYHVVNVTNGKTNKTVQVAVVSRAISAGSKADQEMSRLAADIQYKVQDNDNFMSVVEGMGQRVREATKIDLKNPVIPGIENTKDIVKWLYDDKVEVGSISDVIDLQDRYVVAKCIAIREEGTAKLADMREQVASDFIRDKKSEMLMEQIKEALKETQSPESIAKKLNTVVQTIPTLTMQAPQINGIGAEPELQGSILGLTEGQHTKPIKGVSGVYIGWNNGVIASTNSEYNEEEVKVFLGSQTEQMVDAGVLEALKDKAKIKDNRYKFF